ncbi:MAG: short-chain fatty acids transporter [Bradymonadia bacterium]|jgi:short-chain fatty acids transporter
MIARLGERVSKVASAVMPDPFVLALLLTVAIAGVGALRLAVIGQDDIAWTLASGWLGEFASAGLMAFAFKMALILVTGHALALSRPVQRLVDRIARLPRSAAHASALVALVACLASILHWGLGAIVGALLAREIGRSAERRGVTLHYPLLGAAAYSGFALWHGGLSGSAPTAIANESNFVSELLMEQTGVAYLPVSETLFSPLNLAVTGTMLIVIPLLCAWMTPKNSAEMVGPSGSQLPAEKADAVAVDTSPLGKAQRSPVVGWAVGGVGLAVLAFGVSTGKLTVNLDSVVLFFLFLGIALHGDVIRYATTLGEGARGAGAILLQFPFYFGILGLMKASGLIIAISNGLVALSSPATFPVVAFLSAGLVNLVVPSGGGQWAVQGELLLTAGHALGVDPARTVMAFAYGDAWTNLLQPFWALPLLGIMGLRAKDIVGYTAVILVVMGVVVPVLLLLM